MAKKLEARLPRVDADGLLLPAEEELHPVPPRTLPAFFEQDIVFADRPSPVVACTAEEDMARQEYALSADLSYQIQRFGVGAHGIYGELDYDHLDLTRAHELVREAQEAWLRLPKVIRDRYRSWANVEEAARSGELDQVLKTAGATGMFTVAPAVSPSESAAESTPKG